MAAHGFSQRRACRLIEVDPKTVRRVPTADALEIRQRLRDLAGERRRFGYRRLGILLAREGVTMNHKKLYRLYREEGLTAPPAWPQTGHRHARTDHAPAGTEPALVARLRRRRAILGPAVPGSGHRG